VTRYYRVREIFPTLQGEGFRTGCRSVFVRFAGCNLWNGRPEDRSKGAGACAQWCDTDFARGEPMTSEVILAEVQRAWYLAAESGPPWIVVTGGEPLLQLDEAFIEHAHKLGIRVAVESNGTIHAPHGIDWLTISPKRGAIELRQLEAHELKVVLPGGIDGDGWSTAELEALSQKGEWQHRFVQPQDVVARAFVNSTYLTNRLAAGSLHGAADEFNENLKRCIDFVHSHPQWRLSYQMHKAAGLR
jgi:7-carboxy-7-deazaguanine synthase